MAKKLTFKRVISGAVLVALNMALLAGLMAPLSSMFLAHLVLNTPAQEMVLPRSR
jgi:hypothetical protein